MEKKINLEDILNEDIDWSAFSSRFPKTAKVIKSAMKEACRQTLELAAENAEADWDDMDCVWTGSVDKISILNTINQIE